MLPRSSTSVQVFYPRLSREEAIQRISQNLDKLRTKLPVLLVVLFGSYARGNYTVASDVDLLVVYRGKENKRAYAVVKRALALPGLEPHVYAEQEYHRMKQSIQNMTRNGVVLYQSPGFQLQ